MNVQHRILNLVYEETDIGIEEQQQVFLPWCYDLSSSCKAQLNSLLTSLVEDLGLLRL